MTSQRPDKEHPSELQGLLDRIQCGTIEDVSELDPVDIALLRLHYADEELTELFDRLAWRRSRAKLIVRTRRVSMSLNR